MNPATATSATQGVDGTHAAPRASGDEAARILQQAASRAAQHILAAPKTTRWLLACDTDADGLCAGAVLARALLRLGHRFTVRPSRDKTTEHYRALLAQEWDGLILLDKGTSHLALLDADAQATKRRILVVDHHNVPEGRHDHVVLLNPRAEGLDGSRDASASTTALALALALVGDRALHWAPTALAGAIGDWQHMGGWQGWNLHVVEKARATGILVQKAMPRLVGPSLGEAVGRARIPGVKPHEADAWLRDLRIDPALDVEELDSESRARLVSQWLRAYLAHGLPAPSPESVTFLADHDAKSGHALRTVFRVADACGREEKHDIGIAWLMGDAGADAEARALFANYRTALVQGIEALRDGQVQRLGALQVGRTSRAAYSGMVAGIGMTHVLADRTRPVCIVAPRPDGLLQVSTRGLDDHVAKGLDLGRAIHVAAASVGREGGGHPVAAGAVIDTTQEAAFIAALDAQLMAQGFLRAA